jgi:hypothetical protein
MYVIPRRLTLVVVLVAVLVGWASPANASPGDFVTCEQHPSSPECVLDPRTPGSGSDAAGGEGGGVQGCVHPSSGGQVPCHLSQYGWYGGDGCWYRAMSADEVAHWGLVEPTAPGRYFQGTCLDAGLAPVGTRFRVFAGQPGVEVLAQQAVRRLRLPAPAIRVNPLITVDSPGPPAQLVHVPTWLWVDSGSWGTRRATATAGGLSVTATAQPARVEWSTGDGGAETCAGPGTPWKPGSDASKASSCSHTYVTPSPPGGAYTLRATVTWEISWSGGGQSGTRPALSTTSQLALRVLSAGGLNTNAVAR